MHRLKFTTGAVLVLLSIGVPAQESARTVQYHSQDIIPIRAKVKYTTLIELPSTEKIMEAATGDKDFWIVDVVGNFCFVHPAKTGISSNLNLITDKGNIYSFTLQDVSASVGEPDLKVIVQPADRSAIVASSGPPQFVPAAQLAQSQEQLAMLHSRVNKAIDEYKSAYPMELKFDYKFKANEEPFEIQSIYHDDKFTYVHTNAQEKFSVYEIRDGKPNSSPTTCATARTLFRRSWTTDMSNWARSVWTSRAPRRDNRNAGGQFHCQHRSGTGTPAHWGRAQRSPAKESQDSRVLGHRAPCYHRRHLQLDGEEESGDEGSATTADGSGRSNGHLWCASRRDEDFADACRNLLAPGAFG